MAKTKNQKHNSATIGFEQQIWDAACELWGHIPAADYRNMGLMVDRKHRDFSEEDITRLADTFTAFQNGTLEDVKGFCAVATTNQIAAQDYILTPGRYVGIEEGPVDDEPFDDKMKRLTTELGGMFAKSHVLEEEIKKNLVGIGFKI